jgi:hypothetical protein
MPTLILDPQPPEVAALIARRQRLDLDRADEVWEGVYHMNPAPHGRHAFIAQQLAVLFDQPARAARLTGLSGGFNLGVANDYRIPDFGLCRPGPHELYYATAALALEIVSAGDESWQKLPFYAAHHVDELVIVDPQERSIRWLGLDGGAYHDVERSALIDLGPGELAARIDWS